MSDEIGSEFTINFGNAKAFVTPEDGNYVMIVDDYELKRPKKEESAAHGFNIKLTLKMADWEEIGVSEKFRIQKWIYFDVDNPFGAKPFFEAITGMQLEGGEIDPRNPKLFIGEKVGAVCAQETYDKLDDDGNVVETKTVLKVKDFYPV